MCNSTKGYTSNRRFSEQTQKLQKTLQGPWRGQLQVSKALRYRCNRSQNWEFLHIRLACFKQRAGPSANGAVAAHAGGDFWQCPVLWLGSINICTKSDSWHPCSSFPRLVYFQALESSFLSIAVIHHYKNKHNRQSEMASFALTPLTSLDLH